MRATHRATTALALTMAGAPALAADNTMVYTQDFKDHSPVQVFAAHAEGALGVAFADDESQGLYTLAARANLPLSDKVGVLVDVNTFGLLEESDASFWTATAHLWRRDGGLSYGVFGGATFADETDTIGIAGIEARKSLGQQILGGQLSVAFVEDQTAYIAKALVDHYFTDDFKASLSGQALFFDDETVWSVGARAEKRFTGLPVSGFLSGQVFSADGETAYTAFAGIRVFFDPPGSTLRAHDEAVPFSYDFAFFR